MLLPVSYLCFIHVPSCNNPCQRILLHSEHNGQVPSFQSRPHRYVMAFLRSSIQWFICKDLFRLLGLDAMTELDMDNVSFVPFKFLYVQSAILHRKEVIHCITSFFESQTLFKKRMIEAGQRQQCFCYLFLYIRLDKMLSLTKRKCPDSVCAPFYAPRQGKSQIGLLFAD